MQIKRVLAIVVLTFFALLVCCPLHVLLNGAFMSKAELNQYLEPVFNNSGEETYASWPLLPQAFTLSPVIKLLWDSPGFYTLFWNACLLSFPILLGQILVAVPAAWALTQGHFFGKETLNLLYVALMLMPFQVLMVPSYIALDTLGLMGSRWAVILPAVFSTLPVFILTASFAAVRKEYLEAARLDGANQWQIFWHLGFKGVLPAIVAVLALNFIESWNAIEQPLIFLKNQEQWPISLYMQAIAQENMSVACVAAIIFSLPALLIFYWAKPYLKSAIEVAI